MDTFKIALLQLLPESTLRGNIEKGISYCRAAKKAGADLALFPEMWSNGYRIGSPADLAEEAVASDGEFLRRFAGCAKELGMAICVTYLEKFSPAPRNSLALFDGRGEKVLDYSKVHTCDFGEERLLAAGDGFRTAELETAAGPVKIGAMICYDREFPESARVLMLQGAEIILVPNACPMEINRLSQLRARAFENMLGIATCNYPAPHPDCNGHSSAFDGVAYMPEVPVSRDTCILEAGEQEGVYIAEFDLAALRAYRRAEVHGNAYRRPEKYAALLDKTVREPFIRNDRKER